MTMHITSSRSPFLYRKLLLGITPLHLLVSAIMLLSAGLHLANLEAIGDANTYYTAAVKSMLQSWRNFFFVAAEPGGAVTVDKPPLGLWVEAAFALVLGVEGWVVSLPNMLAGIFSVPLLFHLVRKHLGALAGLVAALALVLTPIAIATNRNNTMDGMLIFILLLVTWAFVAATESGETRWLFLGAFLVGLGFNIKMLQAFLPLPAFYALYFLGAKIGWGKKLLSIGVSAVILLVVSLSWAVIVDLTPADQRPYIGSSENNTVMELIVGHNGLSRLFGQRAGNPPPASGGPVPYQAPPAPNPGGQNSQPLRPPPPEALEACAGKAPDAVCAFTLPNGEALSGVCIFPPGMDQLACAPRAAVPPNIQPGDSAPGVPPPGFNPPPGAMGDGPNTSPNPNAGSTPFNHETGSPGVARFFVAPLSKQMSWLLPFALVGWVMAMFAARPRLPLEPEHKAFVLWGGWLLTCLLFFSAVEGIFHAYYTIMLAPALGAMVGAGMALFWRWQTARSWVNVGLIFAALLTIGFQLFTARQYSFESSLCYLPLVFLVGGAGLLLVKSLRPAAYLTVLVAMLFMPSLWTGLTVWDRTPNANLPTAFNGGEASQIPRNQPPASHQPNRTDEALVAFLQTHTQDVAYLAAVPNAHIGAPLVLATGRPVLYMGGFGGQDPVIDAAGLAEMVANSELRYVLFSGRPNKQDIAAWLESSCRVVPEFSQENLSQRPGGGQPVVLYRCEP